MNYRTICTIAFLSALTFNWPALAEQEGICTKGKISKVGMPFAKGILNFWSSSCSANSGYAQISVLPDSKGFLHEASITHSSGNHQYDAECLEAVCSLSPLNPNVIKRTDVPIQLSFGKNGIKPCYDGTDVRAYVASHQNLRTDQKQEFVIVHKIPLRFARLCNIPESELQNEDNLVAIKVSDPSGKETFVGDIEKLYSYWASLVASKPVSRQEILTWAKDCPTN
ncbi:MAG: hypothetical protein JSS86_00875 [Cyanobacteria bacterium SZAS LIN-2]|nr:hypothetical protein [Cyanobacteria bacterium SZAS LIN-3]MBS1994823.1 hypothetical protein [Cyanobacteria bacterium SZAS LIN-2]